MLVEQTPLTQYNEPSTEGIEVEIVEAEEIDLDEYVPPDPRLEALSPMTRRCIDAMFNGDVDEAAYEAERLVHLYRTPPRWVAELHGARRRGWRDYNRTRI